MKLFGKIAIFLCFPAIFFLFNNFKLVNQKSNSSYREVRSVVVDGIPRTFIVHFPAGVGPFSLLFAYHPATNSGEKFERISNLHNYTDKRITVYPDGIDGFWNADSVCCGKTKPNDIAFFDAMIADLSTVRQLTDKHFATGYSNGAIMVHTLICHRSNKLIAAAPFAATRNLADSCPQANPVSIFMMHGLEDTQAPYEGISVPKPRGIYQDGVPETFKAISARMNCSANVEHYNEIFENMKSSLPAISIPSYKTTCKNNTIVKVSPIPDLGHAWPGQFSVAPYLPYRTDLNGSQQVINFFDQSEKSSALTNKQISAIRIIHNFMMED